jgi:hypothetical protein
VALGCVLDGNASSFDVAVIRVSAEDDDSQWFIVHGFLLIGGDKYQI